ncbi:MAG: hypothetical protein K940chlam9_00336 [Chlamydiae bacterium]|nr:hypothetical protein [Chlamydiota bacterium]
MNPDIFRLKEMILLFRNELIKWVLWEKEYALILSERDPIKPWEKAEAYSWIFFETKYMPLWSTSEETKRRNRPSCYPETLLKKAEYYYAKWGMKTIEVSGCPTTTEKLKEIYRYKKYGIPKPLPNESLITYIERLRESVTEETYSKKLWRDSLGSFLEFVRANIPPDCHGYIDVIFPEDRAFYSDEIIRLIRKNKYPVNIIFVADILKNLSEELLWGDPRTQHGASETLAFAWLCLISARLRLPTEIGLLYELKPSTLITKISPENSLFAKRYFLDVPTLCGHIPMEISKCQYDYFSILSEVNQRSGVKNRFFKASERSLREVFGRAVNKLQLPPEHGEITFLTLTSWPTEVLHHRTQIDNARYREKAKKT